MLLLHNFECYRTIGTEKEERIEENPVYSFARDLLDLCDEELFSLLFRVTAAAALSAQSIAYRFKTLFCLQFYCTLVKNHLEITQF